MSLKRRLAEKVFNGSKDIYQCIDRQTLVAAPSAGSCPYHPVGTLVLDATNNNWYICTVANTTWVKINA